MTRGGKRPGAGRPKGSGKYGEPTRAVRLPISLLDRLPEVMKQLESTEQETSEGLTVVDSIHRPDENTVRQKIPLYMSPVAAGHPSLSEDYIDDKIDLNRHLIRHPGETFLVRVAGESMIDAGIHPGDLLVVDRALEPTNGRIVIAVVDGELTVKRINKSKGKLLLMPHNPNFQPIQIHPEMEFKVWGVVTNVIHSL